MIKFILGILFCEVGLPLIDSAVELIQLAIENRKGDYAVQVAKKNKEVRKISGEEEEEDSVIHAIGFCAPAKDEEEETENEEF